MYHPELYPELAKKNGYIAPIPLPGKNFNHSQNKNINNENCLNNNRHSEEEIKVIITEDVILANKKDLNNTNEKFPSLLKFIRRAARQKSTYKDELATNYFEINSIRKEINNTGEIYFGINNYSNRSEIIDNYMNIMEADKNDQKFEFNSHTKNIESEKLDLYSKYTPSYLIEKNRLNYLNTEAPALEDLLDELKADNRISNVHDLSGIPSTENSYGKVVRDPKVNLTKIKEYFQFLKIRKETFR